MTSQDFQRYWEQHYPECPPIGHYLREAYADTWFRIHSLPDSKRYPETAEEYREVLRRHNALLMDLIGKGSRYVLITTGYSESPKPLQTYQQLSFLVSDSRRLFSVPKHELEGDPEPYYWHFFMANRTWREHSQVELLKLIADNVISDVLMVGLEPPCIYHPYDGGADVFVASTSIRDRKKEKYASWLSKHPEGL